MGQSGKPCKVEGCKRQLTEHSARGMCQAHYLRWKATGDPGDVTIKAYDSTRACLVAGCGRRAKSRGWCNGHYERWRTTGEAGTEVLKAHTLTGQSQYTTMHGRTRNVRGPAAANSCVACDAQAQHWAYDHQDPEAVTVIHRGTELVMSLDPNHYQPMCIPCHRRLDKSVRPAS